MLINVFLVGAAGGVVAGMLGVGGAVILLPLLSTFGGLTLKQASGVTIVQVIASSLVSWASYQRNRMVHLRLAIYMGAASAVGGLVGGYGSRAASSRVLEWVFLGVVALAIVLLLVPVREAAMGSDQLPRFNPVLACSLGASVGALAGLLGAGGGFLIVPIMIGVLRLPTRMAIGSSPVVILISSTSAFLGKLMAGQIRADLAAALVLGAAPCAYLGAVIGRRLSSRFLRVLLGMMLTLIAARSVVLLLMPEAAP